MAEMALQMNSEIDWRQVRENFPVTERLAYLNSAGAGPMPRPVMDAATRFYHEMMTEGDARWFEWLEKRERTRANIAQLINAEPDEIAFTTNTSSGMNLIVDALEGSGDVISCDLEFPVSTIPWMHRGMSVRFVEAVDGEVRTEDVLGAMSDKTNVICLSHVQYSNGLRLNPEEIGSNKGRHVFVLNASQSAGVLPIDVKRMRVDAMCTTGHKWMLAGYGSGFAYLSRDLLARTRPRAISWLSVEDPFADRNREFQPRADAGARAEVGCPHFAGIFALGEAVRYLLEIGTTDIEQRALEVNRRLTASLADVGWMVLSPLRDETTRSAETLVAADRPEHVVAHLTKCGVAVTVKPQGFRVATHFFNDESDIMRLIAALEEFKA